MAEKPNIQTTPHHLKVTLDEDGTAYFEVICPHDDLGMDRPCAGLVEILPRPSDEEYERRLEEGLNPLWEKDDCCWVREWIAESGEIGIEGEIEVPLIPIRWIGNGWGPEDSYPTVAAWS